MVLQPSLVRPRWYTPFRGRRAGMHQRVMKCLQVASAQRGLIRRDQARLEGASAQQIQRQLKNKTWRAVFPGVYRVAGAPTGWEQTLEAASLWAARDYAISHRAAAAVWGFARFKSCAVEVTVCRKQRTPKGLKCHYTERLSRHEVTQRNGFTVTSAARTLLDLSERTSEPDLRASVDQALRCKWTSVEELEALVERRAHHRGIELLRKLVNEFAGGEGPTESELETKVVELIDAAGLPRPEKQTPVYAGGRLRRLDFKFTDSNVVIEADGYEHHAGIADFERDRARRNGLTARGFIVLQWTWIALQQRPEQLLHELLRILVR